MSYCKAINCYKERNSSYYTDYCSYHRECLDKLFKKTDKIWYDKVWEMETFETWFNGNCGYVITYNRFSAALCSLWIVVYEPATRSIGENLVAIKDKGIFCKLSEAQNKARELKRKLQNNSLHDTPMLEVHPETNSYEYFSSLITSPYVIKEYLPGGIRLDSDIGGILGHIGRGIIIDDFSNYEPRKYLKPLDIIKSNIGVYYHIGIYLGRIDEEDKVCHFSREVNGTRIHSWKEFVEGNYNGEVVRYHPIIPFKSHSKIVRQIAWAEKERFREDQYDLKNRNCEHFANMIVYGINYSEQIYNKFSSGNNGKGSTIKLVNEMSESNDKLGYTDSYHWRASQLKARIEVPPKQNEWDCKIM